MPCLHLPPTFPPDKLPVHRTDRNQESTPGSVVTRAPSRVTQRRNCPPWVSKPGGASVECVSLQVTGQRGSGCGSNTVCRRWLEVPLALRLPPRRILASGLPGAGLPLASTSAAQPLGDPGAPSAQADAET